MMWYKNRHTGQIMKHLRVSHGWIVLWSCADGITRTLPADLDKHWMPIRVYRKAIIA